MDWPIHPNPNIHTVKSFQPEEVEEPFESVWFEDKPFPELSVNRK